MAEKTTTIKKERAPKGTPMAPIDMVIYDQKGGKARQYDSAIARSALSRQVIWLC